VVLAQDPKGVSKYAWSPDGRVGVAIISGKAVAVVAGQSLRTLTQPVDAVVFADDSTTLYGLRITNGGANDKAEVLKIDFDTGATVVMTTIMYPHPQIFPDPALKEAQFADDRRPLSPLGDDGRVPRGLDPGRALHLPRLTRPTAP